MEVAFASGSSGEARKQILTAVAFSRPCSLAELDARPFLRYVIRCAGVFEVASQRSPGNKEEIFLVHAVGMQQSLEGSSIIALET